jgi:hypothetical protein
MILAHARDSSVNTTIRWHLFPASGDRPYNLWAYSENTHLIHDGMETSSARSASRDSHRGHFFRLAVCADRSAIIVLADRHHRHRSVFVLVVCGDPGPRAQAGFDMIAAKGMPLVFKPAFLGHQHRAIDVVATTIMARLRTSEDWGWHP